VTLTLAESNSIIEAAISTASRLKISVCVAVCNRQGHLVAFKRMDGTYDDDADRSAVGKAVASAGTGQPSGEITGILHHPTAELVVAQGMPARRVRGGLPIRRDGAVEGGCGVAGAPSNESDEECARAGIAAFHDSPSTSGPSITRRHGKRSR
jgi:uncharacterized protein GlcG (DUF336 family)